MELPTGYTKHNLPNCCHSNKSPPKSFNYSVSKFTWKLFFIPVRILVYRLRDHSFSTYTKFSKKINISYPSHAHVRVVSGDTKCWSFGKFYVRTKWMILNNNNVKETYNAYGGSGLTKTMFNKFPVKVCENYFADIFMWTPLLICIPSLIFQICKKATISTLKQHLHQCHAADKDFTKTSVHVNSTNKYTATRHQY